MIWDDYLPIYERQYGLYNMCYKSALSVAHIAGGNNLVIGDVYPRMCSKLAQ